MPFPQRYVDELINRLSVRYGVAFMQQYGDAAPSVVKADWCDVLDGWEKRPEDIAWALANLPETPVTAIKFRNLMRAAPRVETVSLPEPKASPEVVMKVIGAAKQDVAAKRVNLSPAQSVLDGLIERAQTSRLSMAQKDFIRTCRKVLREDDPRHSTLKMLVG